MEQQPLEVERTLQRVVCHGCSTRVFAYSTDPVDGTHRCPVCTMRANGTTVCWCGRALVEDSTDPTGWRHQDTSKRYGHEPTPENLDRAYLRDRPWERKR